MVHFESEVWDSKAKKLINSKVYIDGTLDNQIENKVLKDVTKKDKDKVYVVDGAEGSGKSVFSMQLAKRFDKTFCLERVVMNPIEFSNAIARAKRFQCIIYDEAYTGLSSRTALSEINHLLVSLMMEIRQKNLFIIIVLPTIFLLDKYVALWRAKGLFHIYEFKGNRGFWVYYNNKKKKRLYLFGKRDYNYNIKDTKSNFKGRFLDTYVVNEDEYREKKKRSLEGRERRTKSEKYKEQRDKIILIMNKEFNISQEKIGELCQKYDVNLKRSGIRDILGKFSRTGA